MNTKLLASIAVFALLTSVVVSSSQLAFADEAKKDEMKAKKEAKAAEMKAKKEAKAAEMKAKKEAKASEMKDKMAEKTESAGTTTSTTVEIAVGSSSPGCETTNSCYSPADVAVSVGSTVVWNNVDSAAHTVTSIGSDGSPDGAFDSSLFMAGKSYKHAFDTAGTHSYMCIVHPWMKGTVTVS